MDVTSLVCIHRSYLYTNGHTICVYRDDKYTHLVFADVMANYSKTSYKQPLSI